MQEPVTPHSSQAGSAGAGSHDESRRGHALTADHGRCHFTVTSALAGALAGGLTCAGFKRNAVIILSPGSILPKGFFFFRKL